MPFNSLAFSLFLPLVFSLYWLLRQYPLIVQNSCILLASYIFYGWWNWRFLFLIFTISLIAFTAGKALDATDNQNRRRVLLAISLGANLGILAFFKYYGFFAESFQTSLQELGMHLELRTIQVVLPVGLSFYTFQALSYVIDVYQRKVTPTREMVAFFAYVGFFPQLVAGPISRASQLLPQFLAKRQFNAEEAKDGLRQILWGLFKKMVIADNLVPTVEIIYRDYNQYSGAILLLGTMYFAIQVYCDFSGYSDIAIGTARLFGFRLTRNFAFPYFSRNMAEFWHRWHISLSTWFRDYLYIPLGGSRTRTTARHLVNLIVTFTVSGLWHGANWTFIIWGLLHGLYYVPLVLSSRHKAYANGVAAGRLLPSPREAVQMTSTFLLTLFAWIFFRANSLSHASGIIGRLWGSNWLEWPQNQATNLLSGLPYVLALLVIEWGQRDKQHALQIEALPVWVRWATYYGVVLAIFFCSATDHVPFIYFQF